MDYSPYPSLLILQYLQIDRSFFSASVAIPSGQLVLRQSNGHAYAGNLEQS